MSRKSLAVLCITEPKPETAEERYNQLCSLIGKYHEHLKEPRFATPQVVEQRVLDLAERAWNDYLNKKTFGLKKESNNHNGQA